MKWTKISCTSVLLGAVVPLVVVGFPGCSNDHRAKTDSPPQIVSGPPRPRARGFYALGDDAKLAVNRGEYGKAQQLATELLKLAPRYKGTWNYGNAIHDGHMVLGRVALAKGDKKAAIKHLLEAGKTPGSPQLNSFGPNMSLAKDLIAKGEKNAVLLYFDECKRFWKMHGGSLDTWAREVKEGKMPNFGANLRY